MMMVEVYLLLKKKFNRYSKHKKKQYNCLFQSTMSTLKDAKAGSTYRRLKIWKEKFKNKNI